MGEHIVAWQATRERMVYQYLTALQEGDIETVLDVLAKAEQDALLEEMLWQIHEVNLQEELGFHEPESPRKNIPRELLSAKEEPFGQQDNVRRRSAPKQSRPVSRLLQTLAAVIVVGALVGGFLVVLGARQNGYLLSGQQPFGCFVSASTPQGHGWLVSVAAVAENDVWAVGGQVESNTGVPTTLVEHWNGQHWQIVASPNVSGISNVLVSVTALSATDVWAVGQTAQQSSSPVAHTLVEHWDGHSWHIVPSPNLAQQARNTLTGVAAVAANDIWAVGIVNQASPSPGKPHDQGLIEHWDGHSWRIVSNPNPGTGPIGSGLASVVAISKNNVWAVGTTEAKPLIEHWDGQVWSLVASPARSGGLTGISAVGAKDIWAVGTGGVMEHWDGQSWRLFPNDSRLTFNGVMTRAPNDVWAIGNAKKDPATDETLIEHWDGKNWRVVASPDPGPSKQRANDLYSLATTSSGKIWVVGLQQASRNTPKPLILMSTCL